MHVKFWVVFGIIFFAFCLLPATLSPLPVIARIVIVAAGLIPLAAIIVYGVRHFDKSLTLVDDQVIIYEFGRTTSIPLSTIEELMYSDLHEIASPYGGFSPPFFKIITQEHAISYVATSGAWNRKELKAFYDTFPDQLKTHIDKDRAIVQAKMNSKRIGRSGFLDQTKVLNTNRALLKYGLFIVAAIVVIFVLKTISP